MEVTSADCYRKISETPMFQEYKKMTLQIPREQLSVDEHRHFSSFLRSLDASMGAKTETFSSLWTIVPNIQSIHRF
jgi:hypothetical protein